MSLSSEIDRTAFVLEFAEEGQWTNSALAAFAAARGVDADAVRTLWPRGVRDLAGALNAVADARMNNSVPGAALDALIERRFADNAPLKRSVARLAWSDLLHPFDTLARTNATARAMLRCCGERDVWHRRWRLVLAYSAAVLVWLSDRTPDQSRTTRAVRMALALAGF